MRYNIHDGQNITEIVFAGRNRAYGAYVIRTSYNRTVARSLFYTAALCLIIGFSAYIFSEHDHRPEEKGQIYVHDSIYIIPVKLPDPSQSAEKKGNAVQASKSSSSTRLVITDSIAAVPEKTVETNSSAITDSFSTGETGDPKGDSTLIMNFGKKNTLPDTSVHSILTIDHEPEFEGGLKALKEFVLRNVRYPSIAIDEVIEGTVYVKFVVDETGKVTQISLQNRLGYGLDDEALRVVRLLPSFKKPAMKDGQPVKCYYQLPIRYKLR
jgi:protein TonB